MADPDAIDRGAPSRVPPLVAGVVGLPLLWGGGLLLSGKSLEHRLAKDVQSRLDHHFAGVSVQFDGRDAHVSGRLPAGVSTQDVDRFVRHQPGVRHVSGRLDSLPANGALSAPVLEATIGVNRQLTMSGVVPSQSVKDRLLAAAATAIGRGRIDDRLAISATVGPIPDLELNALTELVGSLPSDSVGAMTVTWRNRRVTMSGTATAITARRIRNAADVLAGSANVTDEVSLVQPPPPSDVPTTSIAPSTTPPSAAPTTQPPPPASPVPPTGPVALSIPDITFARDSAHLDDEWSPQLDRIAELLRHAPPTAVIEIEGHTDSTGTWAHNLMLSQQRAEAVRLALIARGVNPVMLRGRARGEAVPVASNATAAGRARNRRAHLRIVS